jgi:hypothetical protein
VALTYELIGSATLGSASNTVVVSSIPTTYDNLIVTFNGRFSATGSVGFVAFNGDTTNGNYSFQEIGNTGNTGTSANFREANRGWFFWRTGVATDWSNVFHMEIPQYKNTSVVRSAYLSNGNSFGQERMIAWYGTTNAINSITVAAVGSDTMNAGTQLNVWGIKGA